jgi:hypothetical protein
VYPGTSVDVVGVVGCGVVGGGLDPGVGVAGCAGATAATGGLPSQSALSSPARSPNVLANLRILFTLTICILCFNIGSDHSHTAYSEILDIGGGMTEQEQKLLELTEKAKTLGSAMKAASFRMRRTRKILKICKDTCKRTNDMIGELNAGSEHK